MAGRTAFVVFPMWFSMIFACLFEKKLTNTHDRGVRICVLLWVRGMDFDTENGIVREFDK